MSDIKPASRYPPVKLSEGERRTFRDAHLDQEKALEFIVMIEKHLDYRNDRGDHEGAREFLAFELGQAVSEAKRLGVERRRASFHAVGRGVVPAVVIAVGKAILSLFGIS